MSRPSVVCNVVAPYRQRLELFGNIFAPPNSSGTPTVFITIFTQKFEEF